jgi:hypothetical protein
VPFQFFDSTDLLVVVSTAGVPTTLVNGTGYTVSGGSGSTGSIVTTSAVPATSQVIITRNTAKTQLTSYTTGDRFPATTHERALDKLTMLVQEATASSLPPTATASGSAPYVLQASSAGATPAWVPQSAGGIAAGAITNTMLAGSITPGKLSTGGPVWDASGNLTATSFNGPVTGAVTGNSSTATRLATTRTIGLSGDVTGTASFDGSANSTIAATVSNGAITASKLGSNEQKQIAKAWVNFNGAATWTNGTTTAANIRSAHNVSSITKNANGDFTINFATPMTDANYAAVVTGQGAGNNALSAIRAGAAATMVTTTSVRVSFLDTAAGPENPNTACVVIFGN